MGIKRFEGYENGWCYSLQVISFHSRVMIFSPFLFVITYKYLHSSFIHFSLLPLAISSSSSPPNSSYIVVLLFPICFLPLFCLMYLYVSFSIISYSSYEQKTKYLRSPSALFPRNRKFTRPYIVLALIRPHTPMVYQFRSINLMGKYLYEILLLLYNLFFSMRAISLKNQMKPLLSLSPKFLPLPHLNTTYLFYYVMSVIKLYIRLHLNFNP